MYEDNETLAFEAQNGDMESLYALYTNVKKLISMKANKFCLEHADRCARAGVTQADLEQEGYFAFVQAVNAYEPESEYRFAAYLSFPLLKAFRTACGLRTSRTENEPLNNATSLDAPIGDEEDGATFADTIADKTSNATDQTDADYDRAIMRQDIEAALNMLKPRDAEVIRRKYLQGQTMDEIAEQTGTTRGVVKNAWQHGRAALRRNERLRRLYFNDIICRHAYNGSVNSFDHTWTSSTERAAIKLEEWEARHNRSLAGHGGDQENAGIL